MNDVPQCLLPFLLKDLPSPKEKKYAHYLAEASWAGARIIQGQQTPQAQDLYDLIILTFSDNGKLCNLEALRKHADLNADEWEDLLQYTAQVRMCTHPHLSILIFFSGVEQPCQLQVFRFHKNCSSSSEGEV